MNYLEGSDYLWCLAKSYGSYLSLREYLFGTVKGGPNFAILLQDFEDYYDASWLKSGTSRAEVVAAYESDKLAQGDTE